MPLTLSDIVLIRKKLAIDRQLIEKREHALDTVEKMLREDQSIDQATLEDTERSPPPSFAQAMRNAIEHFGKQEFSVTDIEELVRKQGVPMPKYPRIRISMWLKEMLDKKVIERTRKGKGSTPHRYRKN